MRTDARQPRWLRPHEHFSADGSDSSQWQLAPGGVGQVCSDHDLHDFFVGLGVGVLADF